MRIAITGSHRVGKTSLIEKLHQSLPDYAFREEPYHELEDSGYFFSENPSVEDYLMQLDHSIEQITSSEDNIIFDRSPLDFLAYIQATNKSDNLDFQSLYNKVKDASNEIDLLVFVPIENPDLINCPESELPELRKSVNKILRDYVKEFNSDFNILQVAGSTDDRRDQVIQHIS
jgi:GTPase SAR1 family protein